MADGGRYLSVLVAKEDADTVWHHLMQGLDRHFVRGQRSLVEAIRCFVAVPLDGAVIRALVDLEAALASALPHSLRWVRPDAMHVTVKFLGDVPTGRIDAVTQAAREAAGVSDPFFLRPLSLDAFPSLRRPRTLVVRLDDADGLMARVAARLEDATSRLGFPRERRKFSPHITLARSRGDVLLPPMKPDRKADNTALALDDGASACRPSFVESVSASGQIAGIEGIWVDQLWVIRSELKPGGPIYTPMAKLAISCSCTEGG